MAVCLAFVYVGTHGCFDAWFQALLFSENIGYICGMSGVGHGWRAVSPVASLVAPHASPESTTHVTPPHESTTHVNSPPPPPQAPWGTIQAGAPNDHAYDKPQCVVQL